MTPPNNRRSVSRRTALAGIGAGSLSLAATLGLGSRRGHVAAQEATPCSPVTPTAWGKTAPINGADLYYEDHGDPDGQPVLLLHGGLGNAEWWANQSPVLAAAGFRVVAMDSRGHGRSTWGDAPITVVPRMAADALGLLDYLGIATTHVVGWSDGAVIALDLAIRHPDRLGRVVAYGANFSPDGLHDLVPSDQLPPFERIAEDYQRLSPTPERFGELVATLDALYQVAPDFSEADLRSIAVPVLVLDGAEEEFIEPEHTRRLAALIPGSELLFMPGTGHFAPFSESGAFNRIVLAFLAGEAVGTPTA